MLKECLGPKDKKTHRLQGLIRRPKPKGQTRLFEVIAAGSLVPVTIKNKNSNTHFGILGDLWNRDLEVVLRLRTAQKDVPTVLLKFLTPSSLQQK
jgi:hypothetical protein